MTTQRAFSLLLVLAGLGSVAALQLAGPSAATPEPAARATTPARALMAGPGRVEPVSEEIDVAAEISGRLAEVAVDEGDVVTAGAIIARLENRDYRARVASAEARLQVARAERLRIVNGARDEERREARAAVTQADAALDHARLDRDRQRRLFAEGVIAREVLDRVERDARIAEGRQVEARERAASIDADARVDDRARVEAAVAVAEASLEEARALLAKTDVRAPIDGVVLRRHKQAGESLSLDGPAPAIVTLADTRVLRVRVEVDERDVADVRVGRRGWVSASAYGDARFPGRVVRVGRMLGRKEIRTDEPSERTDTKVLETLLELDPGIALPIGLRVDAFIER